MARSDANELRIIEGSVCCNCKHLMTRTFIPIDYDDFEMDRSELLMEDGTETPIIHMMCTLACMDLDFIVLNCSRYEEKKEKKIKKMVDK